jgi:ATP-binding cassette subfamily B protein
MMIRMVFYAPLLGVGGVIKVLGSNSSMTWIVALAVSLLMLLIIFVFVVAVPKFKIIQKLVDKLNLVTRENLSGMLVIRAFNTQKFEEDRFEKANYDLMKTNLFVNRIMVAMMPIMMLIMNGTVLLVVWVGANEIASSNMLVGDMMAVMQYSMQIIMAFLFMSMMFILIPRASVSAVRINEILETEPSIDDKDDAVINENPKGYLEFKNVSFKYDGAEENMLKNIDFTAKPGQTTAIIGSTGSGKTTMINLIPRFYDTTEGQILVDGIDVKDYKQKDLRDLIGYVPQKSVLFSGSIESNIKYSNPEMDDENMIESLTIAQGSDIVKEKEEGYQSSITQGGSNVSGGQKQRLSIARAVAKQPDIFLFDDSFSALDFKTDKALRSALLDKVNDKTVLIVAQRISTIKNADQILVLDEGKIVGKGKHHDLLKTCKTYQEIAYSQLSKEELV